MELVIIIGILRIMSTCLRLDNNQDATIKPINISRIDAGTQILRLTPSLPGHPQFSRIQESTPLADDGNSNSGNLIIAFFVNIFTFFF